MTAEYNRNGVKKLFVLFKNLTAVIRVQEKLRKIGIEAATVQTTKNPGRPDCGHALKLKSGHRAAVERAAAEMGVKIMGVYYE